VATDRTCLLIRGALSDDEARALGDGAAFEPTGALYPPSYRDNDRALRHDPALAARLLERLAPMLPPTHVTESGERWELVGLNPRFRLCRYRGGQRFSVHRDGPWVAADGARSFLTLMGYLDDRARFAGGRTRFYESGEPGAPSIGEVAPEAGLFVVFDHALWHDGEAVTEGQKRVIRTDVMFRRTGAPAAVAPDALKAHDGYVWCVASVAGGGLATGGRDGTLRWWREDAGRWRAVRVVSAHDGSVTAIAAASDGALWSGGRDGTVRRWAPDRGGAVVARRRGAIVALAARGDGVAIAAADGSVAVASPAGDHEIGHHAGWAWCVAHLPGGAVVSGGDDGLVRTWGDGSATALGVSVRALSVGPTGAIAAGLADGRVLVEGRPTGRHGGAVTSLAWLDSTRLVSTGEDAAARRWDVVTGSARVVARHDDFVRSVAVLAGRRVATVSYDGTLRVATG
jgi:WD40 repeat protein